jgi:hypothetical protein
MIAFRFRRCRVHDATCASRGSTGSTHAATAVDPRHIDGSAKSGIHPAGRDVCTTHADGRVGIAGIYAAAASAADPAAQTAFVVGARGKCEHEREA